MKMKSNIVNYARAQIVILQSSGHSVKEIAGMLGKQVVEKSVLQ